MRYDAAMLQYEAFRLMHRHGSEWGPMVESRPHDPVEHDIEQAIAHGARVFRCESCNEEVAILPPDITEPEPDRA